MAALPIPAAQFFKDFAFDLTTYQVERAGSEPHAEQGLNNRISGRDCVIFLITADVRSGDVLCSGTTRRKVQSIQTDTFDGLPDCIIAFL